MTRNWTKSTFSAGANNCVETRRLPSGEVQVRHSRSPDGPVITYTTDEWAAFIAGAKDGQFD
jgi:hypothetical protein